MCFLDVFLNTYLYKNVSSFASTKYSIWSSVFLAFIPNTKIVGKQSIGEITNDMKMARPWWELLNIARLPVGCLKVIWNSIFSCGSINIFTWATFWGIWIGINHQNFEKLKVHKVLFSETNLCCKSSAWKSFPYDSANFLKAPHFIVDKKTSEL